MEIQGRYYKYKGRLINFRSSINGVYYNKYSNKYLVNIELKNKTKYLGITENLEEGLELYLKASKKYKSAKVLRYWEQQSLF